MSLLDVATGVLGSVALGCGLVLAAWGAGQAAARLLGLRDFEWFGAWPAGGAWWRRLLARVAMLAAPWLVCSVLFVLVYRLGGVPENSTVVEVLPGPAEQAGMQDGDRVLSIDGQRFDDWESLRSRVQAQPPAPRRLEIERDGQRLELWITPSTERRIGVTPRTRQRPLGIAEAVALGAPLPLQVARDALLRLGALDAKTDLRGPVGIVKQTGGATRRGTLALLYFLGMLGSYFSLLMALTQPFDVATGWLFRRTHQKPEPPYERSSCLARWRQTLVLTLLLWAAYAVGGAIDAIAGLGGLSLPLVLLVLPASFALWFVIFSAARELYGWRRALGILALSFIPLAVLIVAASLVARLRVELERQGFRVALWSVTPPPPVMAS